MQIDSLYALRAAAAATVAASALGRAESEKKLFLFFLFS